MYGKSEISVPMFVCLAGYLDVLAFLPKFINVGVWGNFSVLILNVN